MTSTPIATSQWLPRPAHGRLVYVLEHDVDLPRPGGLRADRAIQASRASILRLATGSWRPPASGPHAPPELGLLVLDGLLLHRVRRAERCSAELLSRGDLLQADADEPDRMLTFSATWRVGGPTRLAVLDAGWMARMAPYPEVMAALAGRALRRAQRLAESLTITQQPLMEERLMLLFWYLAERFGTVCTDGVRLDLRLTHDLLAQLAGARRPSVSAALTRLQRQGRLRRHGQSWVLVRPFNLPTNRHPSPTATHAGRLSATQMELTRLPTAARQT